MIDIQNRHYCPALEEIGDYVQNPVFSQFCAEIMEKYQCRETIEFSSCSLKPGWNIKFRKGGKTLCTLYPGEHCFTAMVVVGKKEKAAVEELMPDCSGRLREIYEQTGEGNGQRWLMIDLEDRDQVYRDVFRLVEIRRAPERKKTA